jgi:hypothetical protein
MLVILCERTVLGGKQARNVRSFPDDRHLGLSHDSNGSSYADERMVATIVPQNRLDLTIEVNAQRGILIVGKPYPVLSVLKN